MSNADRARIAALKQQSDAALKFAQPTVKGFAAMLLPQIFALLESLADRIEKLEKERQP